MRKTVLFVKYILHVCIILAIVLYAGLYLFLSIPAAQNKMRAAGEKALRELLNTEVSIGKITITPFNKLAIRDLYIADKEGDTLLFANKAAAGFEWLPLFQQKISFRTIQLFGFQINLHRKTPEAALNTSFLEPLFTAESTSSSPINLHIRSILIRKGNLRYDVESLPPDTNGHFDPHHIRLENLLATLSLKAFTPDTLHAVVKRMSFREQSGFSLQRFSAEVTANRSFAVLNKFALQLPASTISLDSASIQYGQINTLDSFYNQSKLYLQTSQSRIVPADFAAFIPTVATLNEPIQLSCSLQGSPNALELLKLKLESPGQLTVSASGNIHNLTAPDKTFLLGKITHLALSEKGLNNLFTALSTSNPSELARRIGELRFRGEVSGYFDNLVSDGIFSSPHGSIQTDLLMSRNFETKSTSFKGNISSKGFDLSNWSTSENQFGTIAFQLNLDGNKPHGELPSGKLAGEIASFDWNGYKYEKIQLNGAVDKTVYTGSLSLNDLNGKLAVEGSLDLFEAIPQLHCSIRADSVHLHELKLIKSYPNSSLSFNMDADFSGSSLERAEGWLRVQDFHFRNNGETFRLDSLQITAQTSETEQQLTIESDLVNAHIAGSYTFSTIGKAFLRLLDETIPVTTPAGNSHWKPNDFSFEIAVDNSESFSKTFEIPWIVSQPLSADGAFLESEKRYQLFLYAPELYGLGNKLIDNRILIEQIENRATLSLQGERLTRKNDTIHLSLDAVAQSDTLGVNLLFANQTRKSFEGRFDTRTRFFRKDQKSALSATIDVDPTQILINDTIWELFPATLFVDSGRVSIRDFEVRNESQFVRMEGNVSSRENDTLQLSLHDINLNWLFETLAIKNVTFGGRATGDFFISQLGRHPHLETHLLSVKGFSYNDAVVGDLALQSHWNNENQGIRMVGDITPKDSLLKTEIDGYIFPTADSISLHFDAEELNVAFLRPFLDNILTDLSGTVYGKLHFYGDFSRLNVVGNAYLKDLDFGIDYLNTRYNLSDSLFLTTEAISLKNARLYDKFGHSARVNGKVLHRNFKNFSYDFAVEQAQNLLLYNVSETSNPLYFGTVYGSGYASLRGDESATNLEVNMRTEENSIFTFVLSDISTAGVYEFITYTQPILINRTDSTRLKPVLEPIAAVTASTLNVNLQLDVTPDATIQLIMNPTSGDLIKANGSGNIRLDFSNYSDLRLYGTYTVDKGNYSFSLQDVISRNFALTSGSSITFRGNPMNADLDLSATYSLTANLSDLDESFAEEKELSRTNVPVRTVLSVTGDLERPDIGFNLQFPTLSQDVERRVRSVISSDDMLNRQVIYLLALGKFYTPEYMNMNQRSNELASMASSTLSSQLNNLLNQISDNWNIGTKFSSEKGDFSDMEFELALSSQLLNNRLIFNGNFGYRDNITTNNTFIGDFDLEYLLNRSGNIRLKAYNHYNDRNYNIKSALTTQGVGIIFKRDFSRIRELFSRLGRKPEETRVKP